MTVPSHWVASARYAIYYTLAVAICRVHFACNDSDFYFYTNFGYERLWIDVLVYGCVWHCQLVPGAITIFDRVCVFSMLHFHQHLHVFTVWVCISLSIHKTNHASWKTIHCMCVGVSVWHPLSNWRKPVFEELCSNHLWFLLVRFFVLHVCMRKRAQKNYTHTHIATHTKFLWTLHCYFSRINLITRAVE